MNILRKTKKLEKETTELCDETDRLKKENEQKIIKCEQLKLKNEELKKEITKALFLILDNESCGIPFDTIERLREIPTSKEVAAKIVYVLNHAYDSDTSFSMDAPLWYAIVAETHLCEELIDPVIGIFTVTDDDWDFLNEQGLYLLGKLAQKYPDQVMKKVTEAIDKMISKKSKFPFLFLFDAFYFADVEKYKDWFLRTLKNPDLYWLDSYAMYMGNLQIKEVAPIMKEILGKLDERESENSFTKGELEEAIEQIETGIDKYPEVSKPYCESREEWKKHYKHCENRFTKSEDDDDYENYEPETSQKIGRNEPCPCGSEKKYKKCCGK